MTDATSGVLADGMHFDAIVVGSGHNGLIAAGYLAKAGKKVLVLERRSVIGGATVTEELFPGFRLSTCSYVCNLLLPEVIADLDLTRHGYDVRPFDPQYFVPFPDGRYFMSFLDGRKTREQIAKFSTRDVTAYDAYWEMWDRIVARMRPLLLQPAPSWDQIEERFSGPQGQEDWRTLTRKSIAELLDEYFESEEIKAPLSTGGVIGVNAGPMTPGTAYVKYHHLIGSLDGHQGAWGFVRGGMGSVANAIAAFGREHGATIATDSEVAEIDIQDGSARGVRTIDGRRYSADVVLSNADPTRTFLGMVGESRLPGEFADGVKRIKVKPGARLSLQSHARRAEHWVVVRGTARVTRDNDVFELFANQSTYIPIGAKHRLENPGKDMLELIEVQSGDYLGEDDIVRYEDVYGRS